MKMPSRYFRAGVGAVIANADGAVLALERSDVAGAWQLPQGGWESGETVEQAVFREIEEETGLTRRRLILVERYPEPLIYELPRECQSVKAGLGQVQYWFLMRLRGKDLELTLPGGGEFQALAWMSMGEITRSTALFRRALYRRLEAHFQNGIRPDQERA